MGNIILSIIVVFYALFFSVILLRFRRNVLDERKHAKWIEERDKKNKRLNQMERNIADYYHYCIYLYSMNDINGLHAWREILVQEMDRYEKELYTYKKRKT